MQDTEEREETKYMAKQLATYMRDLAWSQAELRRRTGLSEIAVHRAVSGELITRATASKIIKALSEELGTKILVSDISGIKVEGINTRKRDTRRKKQQGE